MSWEKSIEELRRRERLAEHMGGEEPVERQRGRGKLTVRERVAFLADPGSFHEIGKIAGKATYGTDDELSGFTPSTSVMNASSMTVDGSVDHIRTRICDAGLYAPRPSAVPSADSTTTVSPGCGEPCTVSMPPLKIHGCRRSTVRSRPSRKRTLPVGARGTGG